MQMFMRRILLLFLLLLQIGTIYAQKDTVRYGDPWYLFSPLLPQSTYTMDNDYDYSGHYYYPRCLQIYPNVDDKTPVYGIAIVADTIIGKIRPSDIQSRFKAILFDSIGEENQGVGMMRIIHVEEIDSVSFNPYTRLSRFEYQYNYERQEGTPSLFNPGTRVYPCFEFYFDTPQVVYGDNICVGQKYDISETWTWDREWHFVNRFIHDSSSVSFYYSITQEPGKFVGFAGYNGIAPFPAASYAQFNWGGLFPIVKLRCTRPRQVHETERGSDRLTIAWQGHDETSDFQVRIYAAGTPADSVDPVDVSGTSYIFTELVPDVNYLYSVRKRCHYATDSYDTVVYSEWYPPQQLRLVGIDEVGAPRFSLSPNPASETVVVTFAKPADGCRMELYDASGRQVDSQAVADGATTATLDVRRYAAGVYLLKTVSPAGATVRKLVVR